MPVLTISEHTVSLQHKNQHEQMNHSHNCHDECHQASESPTPQQNRYRRHNGTPNKHNNTKYMGRRKYNKSPSCDNHDHYSINTKHRKFGNNRNEKKNFYQQSSSTCVRSKATNGGRFGYSKHYTNNNNQYNRNGRYNKSNLRSPKAVYSPRSARHRCPYANNSPSPSTGDRYCSRNRTGSISNLDNDRHTSLNWRDHKNKITPEDESLVCVDEDIEADSETISANTALWEMIRSLDTMKLTSKTSSDAGTDDTTDTDTLSTTFTAIDDTVEGIAPFGDLVEEEYHLDELKETLSVNSVDEPDIDILQGLNHVNETHKRTARKKKDYFLKIRVQLETGHNYLYLYDNIEPKESVQMFCDQNKIEDQGDLFLKEATKYYILKKTNNIFNQL